MILNIYEYTNYKKFTLDWLKTQPGKGRGFFSKAAQHLRTSNAAVSQIFGGDRELNLEQAIEFCELLHLNEEEVDFFLNLVELGRAGSQKLKLKLLKNIEKEKQKKRELVNRVRRDTDLSEQTKSTYYSSWVYTGARNLIATNSRIEIDELSNRLHLSNTRIKNILKFLLENGLLVQAGKEIKIGPQKTHLESESPIVLKHHQNWRLKALEMMQDNDKKNLFYTGPMSLSNELALKLRDRLPALIKDIIQDVGESKSEVVRCLNIDFFEY